MISKLSPIKHIKTRIVVWVTVVVLLAVFLFTLAELGNDAHNNREQLDRAATEMVSLAVLAIKTPYWNYDLASLEQVVDAIMLTEAVMGVTLLDADGNLYYEQTKHSNPQYEKGSIQVNRDIAVNAEKIGSITLTMSPYFLQRVSTANRFRSLLQSAAMLIAIIASVSVVMDYIIRPLVILEEKTLEIADGNLENEIPIYSQDEVGLLAQAIRTMQHKLKLTLMEIRSHVETLTIKNSEINQHREEIESLYQQTKALNDELTFSLSTIQENYRMTVLSLANAIEANDVYTKGHCERVTQIATAIARELSFSQEELMDLEIAALLHDIGKIGIPHHILNKPSPLTADEYDLVKKHPEVGYEILKHVSFLKKSSTYIREHHERYDGKGYPKGKAQNDISLQGRILSLADAYDAMVTARPYRAQSMTKDQAIAEIKAHSSTQFDPLLVTIFEKIMTTEGLDSRPSPFEASEVSDETL